MELIFSIRVMSITSLTEVELEVKIVELKRWYMPIDLNPAYHYNKKISMKKLNVILQQSSRSDLQKNSFSEILLCALTLLYFFGMRLKLNRSPSKHFRQWYSKRQFLKAETVFQKTMDSLLPERSEATITIMLAFFTNAALWPYQDFVVKILEVYIYNASQEACLLNNMLTDIRQVLLNDVASARLRLRVLFELLNSKYLVFQELNLIPIINRLLDDYTNDMDTNNSQLLAHAYLKEGFKFCLRRIFENVPNELRLTIIITMLSWPTTMEAQASEILEVTSLVQYAAEVYKVGPFCNSLPDELVVNIMNILVGSTNWKHSLVGCHLMNALLDRQHNAAYLSEPKLYYESSKTYLMLSPYDRNDKVFFKRHREKIHQSFLLALTHCEHNGNLRTLFTMVCCMILEVPCGLTATAAAFMMMAMQDYALTAENISQRCRHWMHATVISVMSLMCWVHKAPKLYEYVNLIISRRARYAPELNPPLKLEDNETHPHTWTRTTLFFQYWELRYALWKSFSDRPG